jgi:peptidoglycan glycosyltransferase
MFASGRPRGAVRWVEPGRRRRRRLPLLPAAVLLLLAAGAVAAFLVLRAHDADRRRTQATVTQFADAWERGATQRMWELLGARSRAEVPRARFAASYGAANRAATVSAVRVGKIPAVRNDRVRLPVTVRTRLFGTLRGSVTLPLVRDSKRDRIAWTPELRLPGLRPGENVRRRVGASPRRASVLDAAGRRLDREPTAAAIAGRPPAAADRGTGLERLYNARLSGRPSAELRFGRRVIAGVPGRRGRSVRATIRPGLQRAAVAALGDRLGGVAVLRPRDGAVLALAGLAVSAPQPPGSTFKIVTLAAVLQAGIVKPSSTYPVRTSVTLSGVRLRNAGDEACGGSLTHALTVSCNAVFAPIGARLGAKRLAQAAQRFGFNQVPRVPAAVASRFPAARELRDSLAVGAAAIGQDRVLATPLQMAAVAATIANRGVHAAARIARSEKVVRRRAVSARVAGQVREMMRSVVRSGTGTAAALPGVDVAGKTGTAELRPTADAASDPKNTDAWFVAFAPAAKPRVAVAVMLVGAGAGGKTAAPIARQVLQAAL